MITAALDRLAAGMMPTQGVDFAAPAGEPAIVPDDSVSWRVFANPVSLFVGGIAAVLLELGEPRVRHGVWDHSSFRRDPARRLQRTGLAAMVTVYGARSQFEALSARVRAMHARVRGTTPDGQTYDANDPELLLWVQVTAAWGFLEAYRRLVRPLGREARDRYYAEGRAGAALYGVEDPPGSEAAARAVFAATAPLLEPSAILDELIAILRSAPILPLPLRPMQRLAVRAAVDLLPPELAERIGVARHGGLGRAGWRLLRTLAATAERVRLPSSPAVQAQARLRHVPAPKRA